MNRNKDYYSFLLRLKQVNSDAPRIWVVSVQNTHTGQQQIFSNLDGLIQFLQEEFGSSPEQNEIDSSAMDGTPGIS